MRLRLVLSGQFVFNLVDVKRVIERVLSQGGMCGLEEDGRWEPGGRPRGRGHGG